VIIRHPASGSAHRLAGWLRGTPTSVINAGDGTHEHPTQALLDAATLRERLGGIADRRIAIVGDVLHSRVARSNALLLRTLGAEVTLVAPPTLLPVGIESWPVETSYDLDAVLPKADAVMMLRVQRERMSGGYFPTPREYTIGYGLTRNRLATLRPGTPICHPGPMNRGLEISAEAADATSSLVLNQVAAGVAVRMAVLYQLLGGADELPLTRVREGAA
jgi:aspartate carbamoyltransferase catalytic subunit